MLSAIGKDDSWSNSRSSFILKNLEQLRFSLLRYKSRPLAEHLVDRGDLNAGERDGALAMVSLHVKKHGGDPAVQPRRPHSRLTRR
jgi:hypothetical protein